MDLIEAVKIIDNCLPQGLNKNLNSWLNLTDGFEEACIMGSEENVVKKKIRQTETLNFNILSKSLTNVSFFNILGMNFKKHILEYIDDFNGEVSIKGIQEISALKYVEGGHYVFHTDHHHKIPRTLSLIYMVNDDYTGGTLCFKGPKKNDMDILKKVEPKSNRLIIWPSSHLFPHAVEPVTEGVRYSVVCWAV